MSDSSMVSYTKISPNHSGKRTMTIDRITPHCIVGQCSVETLGNIFADPECDVSSNYGIGVDGRVGLYVPENCRSWCSSSNANDQRAVTIECASSNFHPYAMNDAVYKTLVDLCVDICKRNGKTKLLWFWDKEKTLSYEPEKNEMVLSVHRWFAKKSCPGDWLYNRLGFLANVVTSQLSAESDPEPKPEPEPEPGKDLYRVQVGAFRVKKNAENYLEKIRKAGFPDAFITVVKDYYK